MKVGILTFINAYNMGAVLQGFALQKKINAFDHVECELIDYVNEGIRKQYQFPRPRDIIHTPKNSVMRALSSVLLRGRYKKIRGFAHSMKLSGPCDLSSYIECMNAYELIVVGSDQVWNPAIIGNDLAFFLKDVQTKAISYSASIGVAALEERDRKEYTELLKKFCAVAVRENSAKELLTSWGMQDVRVTCDPVFLLDLSDWEKIAVLPTEKEPYILVYKINNCTEMLKYARALSKHMGMKLVYIPSNFSEVIPADYQLTVSPEEWLGWIGNASYVITNSFHCTAFCIIYNRNFAVEVDRRNNANSRLTQLVQSFNLGDRIMSTHDRLILDQIDYSEYQRQLDAYRSPSIQYLSKHLEGY